MVTPHTPDEDPTLSGKLVPPAIIKKVDDATEKQVTKVLSNLWE